MHSQRVVAWSSQTARLLASERCAAGSGDSAPLQAKGWQECWAVLRALIQGPSAADALQAHWLSLDSGSYAQKALVPCLQAPASG